MKDNIVNLNVVTILDIEPSRVINALHDAQLQEIVVVGYDQEGELYFALSHGRRADALLLLEEAKKELLNND